METVLRGLPYEVCLIYLDDIIILGCTFKDCLSKIQKELEKLRMTNLKLNPSKCNGEVSYLGHIISAKGVRTDPEKDISG